jgi:hypothetical protein
VIVSLTVTDHSFRYTATTVDFEVSGLGTELQTGMSRVRFQILSLEFFIGIILPAASCPWGSTQLLAEMVEKIKVQFTL